jgi:hypothetical protein
MVSAGVEAEAHQETGIPSASVAVEVRSSGPDANEPDVDVEAVPHAGDVAE